MATFHTTRWTRRRLLGSLGAGVPAAILGSLACPAIAFPTARVASATRQGGAIDQLILGSLEEPPSLSPLVDMPHHFPEHVPQTLLFDSLTQYMPDNSVAPKLAETWTVSPDNLVYTFSLNPAATFHDGTPVTADDVKFTIDALLDPATGSSTEGVDTIDRVEVLDPRTVRIILSTVTPAFLAQGGARGILPKHVFEGQDLSQADFGTDLVGSGPFRLVSYTRGQSIVMEAVPTYYGGPSGVGAVVFTILTEQNVILTQLRSGEIQYALITPRDLAAIEGIPGVQVAESPTPRFFDITPNYERTYWRDQRVREAVLTGIDRQGIVDNILLGHGNVVDANVSPVSWAYASDVMTHPYDPARARALLDAAGWTNDGDGTREKGEEPLSFGVMINNFDSTLEQAMLVAQQNLRDIGVELRIEQVDPGVFNERRSGRAFDAFARVWNPVYDPDQAGLFKTGNASGYSNAQVDALFDEARGTTDRDRRAEYYARIQRILSEDVAHLWLYTENELHALPADIVGVRPHPVNVFWNLRDWKAGS